MPIRHKYVSPKADGPDTTLVRPSNWNADLEIYAVGGLGDTQKAGDILAYDPTEEHGTEHVRFAGAMIMAPWASSPDPPGWLYMDGREVSRTTYARLFEECGVRFGAGDGSTTFNIPDGRGRYLVGADSAQTRVQGLNTVGATGGSNQISGASLPPHVHTVPMVAHHHGLGSHTHTMEQHAHAVTHVHGESIGSNLHNITFVGGLGGSPTTDLSTELGGATVTGQAVGNTDGPNQIGSDPNSGVTGGGAQHLPPSLAANWFIKT